MPYDFSFESTRGHAKERMNQLEMVLEKMQEAPGLATVIFAEINLRDHMSDEVSSVFMGSLLLWKFI